ncbi:MAG: hypothetical protein HC838_17510 [Spirulinaceae cyanobacterium RM2_2_10]|nr:hypothetical protein [Spirulinaceae cyanobacterium RM2_2_10]
MVNGGSTFGDRTYGSPYIDHWFGNWLPSALPRLFTYGQMPAAQAAIMAALWEPLSTPDVTSAATFI